MPDDNLNVVTPSQPEMPAETPVTPTLTPMPTPMAPNVTEPPKPPFLPTTQPEPKSSKRKWLLLITLIVVVLGLATGYVFAFYLPAQPSNMYKSGLTNTGKALDALINRSEQQKTTNYKSVAFAGSVQVKSASSSFDFDMSGSADQKGNANATLSADVMGQKFQGNLRSVIPKKSTTPDIYFQVNNAEKFLNQFNLQKYNQKWIVVDHTMLDTWAKNAESAKDKTAPKVTTPTYSQVRDAVDKVQALNKQYLLTTDKRYAVLQNQQFIGKDQIHDRTHYHYKVAYNKDHLKTYVAEVKKALDSSKLNDWSESVNHQKLSEEMKFDNLEKDVEKAKSDYKFDLWVDAKTRVVSQLQFTDSKDSSSKFTIGQNYTGGDQYPFSLSINDKDSNGHPESAALNLTLDAKNNKASFAITGKAQDASGKSLDFSGDFSITPSTKDVTVEAPKDAIPVSNVINDLFGGIFANPTGPLYPDGGNPGFGLSI